MLPDRCRELSEEPNKPPLLETAGSIERSLDQGPDRYTKCNRHSGDHPQNDQIPNGGLFDRLRGSAEIDGLNQWTRNRRSLARKPALGLIQYVEFPWDGFARSQYQGVRRHFSLLSD